MMIRIEYSIEIHEIHIQHEKWNADENDEKIFLNIFFDFLFSFQRPLR